MAERKPMDKKSIEQGVMQPTVRPVNPDAHLMRVQEIARGREEGYNSGECPHFMHAIKQFADVPTLNTQARSETPVNLYQCEICKCILWLVDGSGTPASDR